MAATMTTSGALSVDLLALMALLLHTLVLGALEVHRLQVLGVLALAFRPDRLPLDPLAHNTAPPSRLA